jgi:hypothetical protein
MKLTLLTLALALSLAAASKMPSAYTDTGFTVSGTTDPSYSGTYKWTNYTCDNKPFYQLGDVNGPVLFLDYNQWGGWWIGPASRLSHPGASFGIEVLWSPPGECKDSPAASECAGQWGGPQAGPNLKIAASG